MNDDRKEFIKKLRQNSKKYRKEVLHKAFGCEVCLWRPETLINCLQIHHICPVSAYTDIFFFIKGHNDSRFFGGMPNRHFEMANQIVLCPNCHAMVHAINRKLIYGRETYRIIRKYVMESFYEYANKGIENSFMYSKLEEIATGRSLKQRLLIEGWKNHV